MEPVRGSFHNFSSFSPNSSFQVSSESGSKAMHEHINEVMQQIGDSVHGSAETGHQALLSNTSLANGWMELGSAESPAGSTGSISNSEVASAILEGNTVGDFAIEDPVQDFASTESAGSVAQSAAGQFATNSASLIQSALSSDFGALAGLELEPEEIAELQQQQSTLGTQTAELMSQVMVGIGTQITGSDQLMTLASGSPINEFELLQQSSAALTDTTGTSSSDLGDMGSIFSSLTSSGLGNSMPDVLGGSAMFGVDMAACSVPIAGFWSSPLLRSEMMSMFSNALNYKSMFSAFGLV